MSAELRRFTSDHATAQARARLVSVIGTAPDARALAAFARSQGYEVTDAEVTAAMRTPAPATGELRDEELDAVAAGASVFWGIRELIGELRSGARGGA